MPKPIVRMRGWPRFTITDDAPSENTSRMMSSVMAPNERIALGAILSAQPMSAIAPSGSLASKTWLSNNWGMNSEQPSTPCTA